MIKFEPLGDSTLRARVQLPASPERVYRAWTDPTELALWFRGSTEGHLEVHTFDCRQGGSYDLTIVNAGGDRFNLAGEYLELDPNRRIVMTWRWVPSEP